MPSNSVKVALRVRPLNNKETIQNCNECLSFIPDSPQILFGANRSFTFNHVFPPDTEQEEVFQECAQPLIEKLVEGYNVAILAYGQTGSGKTYSMGMDTMDDSNNQPEYQGIVPRTIHKLFEDLNNKRKESNSSYKFEVFVSFLELYNEDLIDLLNSQSPKNDKRRKSELTIREDANGQVYCAGVKEVQVSSPEDLLGQLQKGLLCRTVAQTEMNPMSSRSHAIFSVILKQTKVKNYKENDDPLTKSFATSKKKNKSKLLTSEIVSKLHFVDLAGSERLRRTNSEGDRAREGIAINGGLLALGNVIGALESRKATHIPYRNSKLTRLLQDSLGGNSQTLMLACVSPADSSSEETLSTLKYASRARNIENKASINEIYGGSSIEISQLRRQISRLKMENESLRASGCNEEVSRKHKEVKLLKEELERTKIKLSNIQEQLSLANSEKNNLLMRINSNIKEIQNLKNQVANLQAVGKPRKEKSKEKKKNSSKTKSEGYVNNDCFPFPDPISHCSTQSSASSLSIGSSDHCSTKSTQDSASGRSSSLSDYCSSQGSTDSEEHAGLTRMLHQIQTDITVKKQLVSQLERAAQEYIHMKVQYEQKLTNMHGTLISLQSERDSAQKRLKQVLLHKRNKDNIISRNQNEKMRIQIEQLKREKEKSHEGIINKVRKLMLERKQDEVTQLLMAYLNIP